MILTVTALLEAMLTTMTVMALTTDPGCTLGEFHRCLQSLMSVTQS
ncbi:hypothetical protein X975_09274, partial [Stegodyphus mimosarum]